MFKISFLFLDQNLVRTAFRGKSSAIAFRAQSIRVAL